MENIFEKIDMVCNDPKRGMQFCIFLIGTGITFACMITYGKHYEEAIQNEKN